VEVSPYLISTVTDSVIDEIRTWQSHPLDAVNPILYLDALQVSNAKLLPQPPYRTALGR
jgi:putative transposase